MNSKADNIIGEYLVDHKGEKSKVKVFKNADGSYTAQVFWVQNRTEKDGSVRKDSKNPDKSLRNVDCDKIVIFKGLKYPLPQRLQDGLLRNRLLDAAIRERDAFRFPAACDAS